MMCEIDNCKSLCDTEKKRKKRSCFLLRFFPQQAAERERIVHVQATDVNRS